MHLTSAHGSQAVLDELRNMSYGFIRLPAGQATGVLAPSGQKKP